MFNSTLHRRGIIEMVLAMMLMGTVGYFVVESGQSSFNVVFFRCLFGSIFLAMFCYFYGYFKNTGITKRSLIIITLSGVFLICNWILLFSSFKMASISTSTVVYHVQPFFFVIIWAAIMKESIVRDKFIWMFIAFLGLILVTEIDSHPISFTSDHIRGILFSLSAALLWAVSAVMVKITSGIKAHLIVLIQLIIGVVILFPFTELSGVLYISDIQWGYLIVLGAIHSCLTYILMYSAYQKIPTMIIAVLTFIYPAVAIFVGFIFYEKILNTLQYIGVFLIMFSRFAVNKNIHFLFSRKAS